MSSSSTWSIRPATPADRPSLSSICLLTGNAGQSAESLHHFPELLGLVYAEPYVVVSPSFGFVLEAEDKEVIGYILGTPDTRPFESAIEKDWYIPLRSQYPKHPYPQNATPSDRHVINLIHRPDTAPEEIISVSKAHVHIDLLPRAQRQGWGTKLMGRAVEYLKEQGCDSLFVGIGTSGAGIE
jgi:GNAT superfamily N-acetyltransferase